MNEHDLGPKFSRWKKDREYLKMTNEEVIIRELREKIDVVLKQVYECLASIAYNDGSLKEEVEKLEKLINT